MPPGRIEDPDLGACVVDHGHRAVRKPAHTPDRAEPLHFVALVVADAEDGFVTEGAGGVRARGVAGHDLDPGAVAPDGDLLGLGRIGSTGEGRARPAAMAAGGLPRTDAAGVPRNRLTSSNPCSAPFSLA